MIGGTLTSQFMATRAPIILRMRGARLVKVLQKALVVSVCPWSKRWASHAALVWQGTFFRSCVEAGFGSLALALAIDAGLPASLALRWGLMTTGSDSFWTSRPLNVDRRDCGTGQIMRLW